MRLPEAAFVVDDDAAIRDAMHGFLRLLGVPVRLFRSASEFLAAYEPDWSGHLFVDFQMAGLNGMDLLDELARRQTSLRIILITGHGSKEREEKALSKGAFAMLYKPFSINSLEALLQCE
jgi:FixJ family two-component response regulator